MLTNGGILVDELQNTCGGRCFRRFSACRSLTGRRLVNSSGIYRRLFHALPRNPPKLREHGGNEDPDKEQELSKDLMEAHWGNAIPRDT